MTKLARQRLFKVLLVAAMTAALVAYMYYAEGWENIGYVFANLDYRFFALALGAGVSLKLIITTSEGFMRNRFQKRVPFGWTLYNELVSDLLGRFSPSTLNVGKITYITCMNRQGLPPSKGTAVMLVHQSCNLIATMLCVIGMLLLRAGYFAANMNWIVWICFIAALAIDTVTILLYLFAPRHDAVIIRIAFAIIRFLHKIRIVKDEAAMMSKTAGEITGLKNSMRHGEYRKSDYAVCILICVVYQFVIYATHYFSAMAMGVKPDDTITFIASLAFFNLITGVVPIPGGVGVNDVLYHSILIPVVGDDHINFMILFYRMITYYFALILDAMAFLFKCPVLKKGSSVKAVADDGGAQAADNLAASPSCRGEAADSGPADSESPVADSVAEPDATADADSGEFDAKKAAADDAGLAED